MISLSSMLCLSLPVSSLSGSQCHQCLTYLSRDICSYARSTYPYTHKYMYYIYIYMNSLLFMQIVEYNALLFFHLIYLRAHSKLVPKELSYPFMLLCVIPGCSCYLPNWFTTKGYLYFSHFFYVTINTS